MGINYYFENEDAEFCYPESHFQEVMNHEELSEIEVMEAIPYKSDEFFWCKWYGVPGEKSEGGCGKECKEYKPRNGKNGCCTHYTNRMFDHGEKVILKNGNP